MSFEEKMTWVTTVIFTTVTAWYAMTVASQLGQTPVGEIPYQVPMIVAVGVTIVLSIVGAIVMSIGTAIAAEVTGNGSIDEIDRKDERDIQIGRRGDLVGYYVSSVAVVGVLALTMLEYDYFWIANALYLSFAVGSIVGSIVKLVAYRRGF